MEACKTIEQKESRNNTKILLRKSKSLATGVSQATIQEGSSFHELPGLIAFANKP